MLSLPFILMIAPPILIALTFHEFAHAYVANKLGDPTAKDMGRLTLNPLTHLDIVGTIMVFLIHIGWAKPVPVNPLNFRNPKRDLLWVSLAGPMSNILLAFIAGLIFRLFNIDYSNPKEFSTMGIIPFMLAFSVLINLILAFFNILPIPPLDGSKILGGLLPAKFEPIYNQFLGYGHFVLLGLIVLSMVADIPIFSYIYLPFVRFFSVLFAGESFKLYLSLFFG
jgi:Zn-dependent protease